MPQTSWNTAENPSWYNTRTRGPPCGSPPRNPWTLLTLQWIDVALVWSYQAPRILYSSRLQLRTIFVPSGIQSVCVCVSRLKDGVTPSVFVLCFREQLNFSQCLVGNHNWTSRYLKVCVCAKHILKDGITQVFLCFSKNSLLPVGSCAIFSREQFLFQHFTKKKRDIIVFRTNTVFAYSKAHLTAYVSQDELLKAGIVCLPSKLL